MRGERVCSPMLYHLNYFGANDKSLRLACVSSTGKPILVPLHLPSTRLLLVCGNELVDIGNLQFSCMLVMSITKWIDVPVVVGTVSILDVSTH